jgi:ribosome-binding protein aMBF1 (putative translation factor)
MGKANVVRLDGREYVILAREEFDRLTGLAKVAEMPALPEPDQDGNYPAVEYARASIARDLVRERAELGLSQRDLARLASVRVETLCRIETGKHTASTATLAKLDRALQRAKEKAKVPKRRKSAS